MKYKNDFMRDPNRLTHVAYGQSAPKAVMRTMTARRVQSRELSDEDAAKVLAEALSRRTG